MLHPSIWFETLEGPLGAVNKHGTKEEMVHFSNVSDARKWTEIMWKKNPKKKNMFLD